ncbi:ABC transporter permease [Thermoanaerobacterium thermosaccharolyticum]|uniref:ABC transporter permease n=1 Tax=Thermoanaerobacterium thermosaccharolyticum TaxID=1517 RepID=A0A231VHW9_THETR|nr:ABC transporter permease subunit [Thermoanaerobacterium thermosaccharolyticum]OXT07226.1 ABC transporter permease [Thermoanaerobacterium thermosaccharolyticum]
MKHRFKLFLPVFILIIDLLIDYLLPNTQGFTKPKIYPILLSILIGIYVILSILSIMHNKIYERLLKLSPLLSAVFIIICVWDLVTSKYNLLPLPYFPGPEKVFGDLFADWSLILISALYSLRLLFVGYIIGTFLGFISGVLMGWNKKIYYWLNPLLKVIGPIPATAWIPLAMAMFPTSFMASVFIIALAVWFPVTVMTSSGIANVPQSYFEVAKTLGADEKYLVFNVAIPASLPTIFIGLFMGLGMSFLTLIVSEMLGVKAGLGWYINWAQGWAEYSKVYACLLIIAIIFSTLISILFKFRDKILSWQRGLIKW